MRALLSKVLTGSMVAGAALMVSACGGSDTATTENTVVTDINATDMSEGTMTDNMTPMDATSGNDMMMTNDTGSMDSMANGSDSMMTTNTTTTTTNAM